MPEIESFDLLEFLPYLLNQAADKVSLEFQTYYKDKYGMLRTDWRVLFHVGRYQLITAKEICDRGRIHKTKVSRAVAALEKKRFLTREDAADDRRNSVLSLTNQGQVVYRDLLTAAQKYDKGLRDKFSAEEAEILHRCLVQIAGL